MEVTVAWFWIIGVIEFLIILSLGAYSVKLVRQNKKNWPVPLIGLAIVYLLFTISPIKIGVSKSPIRNIEVQKQHIVPKKISDDSFKNGLKNIEITKENLK